VNRDDLRLAHFGRASGLTREQENEVSSIQKDLVRMFIPKRDVVIDDTNLNAKFAKEWLKLATEVGAEVEWWDQFLEVPLSTCIARDAARTEGRVGADVIMSFYKRYFRGDGVGPKRPELDSEPLPTTARYEGTPNKPKAFLVDLDGTIAQRSCSCRQDSCRGSRGYFDWARVGEDLPVKTIIEIVKHFEAQGLEPIFVSGRDAVCYGQTMRWILQHVYGYNSNAVEMLTSNNAGRDNVFRLYMRPEGDMRKDSIVKLEIFDNDIRDNWDVQFCLDDRDQVVAAYRSIGLTVLQVADGKF
jgi:predicted kinase